MAARRLILAMLVLLVLSSAVAALVPVERETASQLPDETMTEQTTGSSGELTEVTVDAGAKQAQRVAMGLGDQLVLMVRSTKAGQVEIAGLGLIDAVDRFAPARFDILPSETGDYPVRLLPLRPGDDPGRVVARVVVGEAGGSATEEPGSSTTGSTAGARAAS